MLRRMNVVLLLMILTTCLTGCSGDLVRGLIREYEDNKDSINGEIHELIDSIKGELSEWKESGDQCSLTKKESLKGERKLGIDDYSGSYEAEYDQFDGAEYIFGGTSTEHENGGTIKVIYSLNVQSGTASLYRMGSKEDDTGFQEKEKYVIAEATAGDTYEFTPNAGDNFIVFEGKDFTGKLSLKVVH